MNCHLVCTDPLTEAVTASANLRSQIRFWSYEITNTGKYLTEAVTEAVTASANLGLLFCEIT